MNGKLGEGQPAELSSEVSARLLRVVSVMVEETRPGRVEHVHMRSHLERELGLDSLARVELLLRVGSEFGKSLPESALAEAETPQDLLQFIVRAEDDGFSTATVEFAPAATTGP